MPMELKPSKSFGGVLEVPGDKSIAHRAALLSILARDKITVKKFPNSRDCQTSMKAAQAFGVGVERGEDGLVFSPPEELQISDDAIIDCGNSATTARLLSGIIAGSNLTATVGGDESLSRRPMKRIVDPLTEMGAEFFAEDDHLPIRISGKKLLPFEYQLPIASAQIKSALLLAALASSCSINVREEVLSRDHTERMIEAIGTGITVREIKPVMTPDPVDPRKKKMIMPESFKKEITLSSQAAIQGGTVDIPGDISTAAFFFAGAAIAKKSITVRNVGLNPTRTGILDHLKAIGCKVEITDRETISGEPRGNVTVTGGALKSRKITGEMTVRLLDEIPAIAVVAAFAEGTTLIRDAAELKVKESNRLEAIARNLELMGIKCGVLDDGLAIEGGKDLTGADFAAFGDHRIAMAFSLASLFLVGPSSIDDAAVVDISCPGFYDLLRESTE